MTHTKESVLNALTANADSLGGKVRHISGDCHAVVIGVELRLAVALKESSGGQKMWVGVPDPLWKLLIGEYALPDIEARPNPERLRIALIHKPNNTILNIPLVDVFRAVIQRAAANRRNVEWSFDVLKTGYRQYFVRRDTLQSPLPVTELGLESLEALLAKPL